MTNVPTPTFGPRGFSIPSTTDVLAGVIADTNEAFGNNLNTALNTPQGQLASSEAAVIDNTNAIFLEYTQLVDPAFSFGRMQDAIGRIYFIERSPAQPTVVQCDCMGLEGVVIPVGALIVATDGTQFRCNEEGVIPVSGTISLPFESTVVGPIPAPADTVNQIYRGIVGWDSVNNPSDGVLGREVESRAAFEERRAQSVALNSQGSLPSVKGAVLAVDGVLDAYVTENDDVGQQVIGGVTLDAKSLYVAVVGGDADAIAQAIWSRKAPGCGYNGNTAVTVYDTSPGYVPPYPAYSVLFQIPDSLSIVFKVTINDTTMVPADAAQQIQDAIIAAFAGSDGLSRARIGTNLFASRFYSPVALLGSWAQIISIKIGSRNSVGATFVGSISGTTLTVASVSGGALAVGQTIQDSTGDVSVGTRILSQSGGTPWGAGTYIINNTQTVGSETMYGVTASLDEVTVNIDQIPVVSAEDITVVLA